MNRDELLDAAFPSTPVGGERARTFDMTETDAENPQVVHVRATLTLDYRRVVVHRATDSPGPGIVQAAETLAIAAISNVATDPDYRRRGYATALVVSAHEEAATHGPIDFAAAFADGDEATAFLAAVGYIHPAGSPEGFMVCPIRAEAIEEGWPVGRVDTRGRW